MGCGEYRVLMSMVLLWWSGEVVVVVVVGVDW